MVARLRGDGGGSGGRRAFASGTAGVGRREIGTSSGSGRSILEENAHKLSRGLEGLPGGQLAIVRYGRDHNPQDEWVYNRVDIDGSKVVWAREMDAEDNLELIHYYPNRRVWLMEPDAIPARIEPYPAQRPQ